jgi:hypothetical protein
MRSSTLPLNLDALEKEGVSATTWDALDDESSATNREALQRDHMDARTRPHRMR